MPNPTNVERLFTEALSQPTPQARAAWLATACAGDEQLRARVEQLLTAHENDANVLPVPSPLSDSPTQATAAPLESVGIKIRRYRLLQQIGEGGFGVVFMAQQEEPVRRLVALKIIKLGMDTRQVIARFEAERQALAMMDHPNVARVLDGGATDTGRPYFVMELVKGIPITEYCDKHNLSIPARLELFVQVCQAVQHAHQKGLIHRDLKPNNVLVSTQDDRPVAKVIDFGIAKATQARLTERTLFTEFHQLVGTPQYMSPEQAEGSLDVDTRSDVYSLGVLLYELLTGTTPFPSKELMSKAYAEIQRIIREVDPPTPSMRLSQGADVLPGIAAHRNLEPKKLSATVRGELDWIVMKALRKDRVRRYDSAAALAADVLHYLADEPVTASAPSRTYRLQKFVRRHRVPVLVTTAFALALVAGTIGTTVGLVGQSRQRAIAEQRGIAAQQSAAIAEAIYRFQGELLFSVDPSQMRGEKVTVVEIIQTAVSELDAGKLKDQPLVEAGLRETIGSAFRSLGRFTEAESNLRKALELRRPALSPTDPIIAGNLFELGLVVRQQGSFEDARKLYEQVLTIGRQSFPPGDRRFCVVLANLSEVLCRLGRLSEAESTAREGLDIARKHMSADNPDLGDAVCALAIALHFQNKTEQAEQLFREGVEIKRRTRRGNPELALRLDDLATCLAEQGKFDQAEPFYLEALQIRRKTLPATHLQLAQNMNNLGLLYQHLHCFADAERLSSEAVSISRQALRPDNPELGMFLNNYGLCLHKMGKLEEAEPVLTEAWQIVSKMPAGTSYPPIVASNFASLLVARGKAGEAEPLYRKAVTLLQAGSVAEPWKLGIMREGLGRALTALKQFPEAQAELVAAESILSANPPQAPGYHARSLASLAALYQAWDQAEPGKGYDAKAAAWRGKLPSTSPASQRPARR